VKFSGFVVIAICHVKLHKFSSPAPNNLPDSEPFLGVTEWCDRHLQKFHQYPDIATAVPSSSGLPALSEHSAVQSACRKRAEGRHCTPAGHERGRHPRRPLLTVAVFSHDDTP
jgi:hypothetical protein